MGRIYDALKRAESAQRTPKPSVNRNGNPDNVAYFVPKHIHPWERRPFTGMPAGIDSASTAHTEEATGGPALPGGPASRDAGATLGAVGSARAAEFSSREVLVARVEPHVLGITEPRSAESAQYQSFVRHVLQGGMRHRM